MMNNNVDKLEVYQQLVDGKLQIEFKAMDALEAARKQYEEKGLQAKLNKELKALQSQRAQEFKTIRETYEAELKAAADSEEQKKAAYERFNAAREKIDAKFRSAESLLQSRLTEQREEDEKTVQNIAIKCAQERYKKANVLQRAELNERRAQTAKLSLEEFNLRKIAIESELSGLTEGTDKYEERKKELEEITELIKQAQGIFNEASKKSLDYSNIAFNVELATLDKVAKMKRIQEEMSKQKREHAEAEAEILARAAALKEDIAEASEAGNTELKKELETELGLLIKKLSDVNQTYEDATSRLEKTFEAASKSKSTDSRSDKEQKKFDKAKRKENVQEAAKKINQDKAIEKEKNKEETAAQWKALLSKEGLKDKGQEVLADSIKNMANKLADFSNSIDTNIKTFYEYQAEIDARLEGSQHDYQKSLKLIQTNVGVSGIIKQRDIIENIKKLVDSGVAYNLDLRAFLSTMQEEIVNTFDAFDANLTRLIRIQQADTTAARMGMEAALKRFLNEEYQDTSYLADAFDNVSQALIDANAQLTRDASIAFEHTVQKWLGALYSVGMDSGTVTKIATGLNYLATGDVESLNSDDALQALFAMSASRANLSYADILTGGLDGDITNKLMKSMVEYLKSIADNTDNNQVTKASYSNLYGMSTTDLKAFSTLSDVDITNLFNETANYKSSMDELTNQLSLINSRTHLSQKLSTMMDNALLGASTEIGNSAGMYTTWMVTNIIEDLTGGINLPAINIFGNMIDLSAFTVTGLIKMGLSGIGLMSSLLGSIGNGSLLGTTSLSNWGFEEFTARGKGIKALRKGTAVELSESSDMNRVGSTSGNDVKQTTMKDAADDADKDKETTNESVEDESDAVPELNKTVQDMHSVVNEILEINQSVSTTTSELLNVTKDIYSWLDTIYTVKAQLDVSGFADNPLPVSLDA